VVVEVKAAKALNAEHEAQLINYLRATAIKVGLLVNFGRSRVEWKRLVW
jgi:GxxExxY protein